MHESSTADCDAYTEVQLGGGGGHKWASAPLLYSPYAAPYQALCHLHPDNLALSLKKYSTAT